MPSGNRNDLIVGIGQVTGATGAFVGRGFTSVRNGVGDYTLTYDGSNSLDAVEGVVLVTIAGAATGFARNAAQTDTTIQVLTFDAAGAAADRNFHLVAMRFAP